MRARAAGIFATLLAAVLAPSGARAHGMRTAYLEVTESRPGLAAITFKSPIADDEVQPRFPDDCRITREHAAYILECDGPLAGRIIGVDGLGPQITEAVVRLQLHDGTALSHLVKKGDPAWEIPRKQSTREVLTNYLGLGVIHILGGADHLLFLLLLALLVRNPRKILLTETAFTISHSVSFSATALGLVHFSSLAAEATIALSLLLAALDVGRPAAAALYEHGWRGPAIALVFGLVHGLGFAGGLSEIGLPDRDVGVALLGFGAGVELGQIFFLATLLVAMFALARLRVLERAALVSAHGAGALSAFWLFQRLWLCLI